MNTILRTLLVLFVLGGLGYLAWKLPLEIGEKTVSYDKSEYGISFSYPDRYALSEREVGNGERRHYFIMMADKKDIENVPVGGEGPPAITLDIYQNNLDNMTLEDWLTKTNNSNFKLSPTGTYERTEVDGVAAVSYSWDGLYRGDTVAFLHGGNIIAVSGTYLGVNDPIREDFRNIVGSFELSTPRP